MGPRRPQDRPKMAPRRLQIGFRWPKMAPDCPKIAQERQQIAEDGLPIAEDAADRIRRQYPQRVHALLHNIFFLFFLQVTLSNLWRAVNSKRIKHRIDVRKCCK